MNAEGQPTLFPQPRREKWPRLSADLAGPRSPLDCQACGWSMEPGDERLTRWQEHDDRDQPQAVLVVLCRPCAERLIEAHPRLYRELGRNDPWPGCMPLCAGCKHRDGLACRHPLLKANGGPGLPLTIAPPTVMYLDFRGRGGRRQGERLVTWPAPASACAGREGAP